MTLILNKSGRGDVVSRSSDSEDLVLDDGMEEKPVITAGGRYGIMIDIETLGLTADAVTTEVAAILMDLDDLSTIETPLVCRLSIQAQLDMLPARRITASTIMWWMEQDEKARQRFMEVQNNAGGYDDLLANLRLFRNQILAWTSEYENVCVYAKGPQFDVSILGSLLEQVGYGIPWKYSDVMDLRTLMRQAGIKTGDVPKPQRFVAHSAYWDAVWQTSILFACEKKLGSYE